MNIQANREAEILGLLRDRYESDGYQFYEYPPANLLPQALRELQLDAIALKDDKKIVIEVKMRGSEGSDRSAAKLAEAVNATPGWDFKLVTANAIVSDAVSPAASTLEALQLGFDQAERLLELNFFKVSLISSWCLLEAVARKHRSADEFNGSNRALTPRSVVQYLYEGDIFSEDDQAAALKAIKLRNLAVHGDLETDISEADARSLLRLAQKAIESVAVTQPG